MTYLEADPSRQLLMLHPFRLTPTYQEIVMCTGAGIKGRMHARQNECNAGVWNEPELVCQAHPNHDVHVRNREDVYFPQAWASISTTYLRLFMCLNPKAALRAQSSHPLYTVTASINERTN